MKLARYIFGIVALLAASCVLPAQTVPSSVGASSSAMPPALQNVGFQPPLNGQIPLDLHFREETGRAVHLREFFGQKPVVLAFVYYRCPMLCDLFQIGVAGT